MRALTPKQKKAIEDQDRIAVYLDQDGSVLLSDVGGEFVRVQKRERARVLKLLLRVLTPVLSTAEMEEVHKP